MPNGDLTEYLGKNPSADRIALVGPPVITAMLMPIIRKLSDVAEGLAYLHVKHAIHGDLKGVSAFYGSPSVVLIFFYQSNVLISRRGRARLTDFGFTSVVRGLNSVRAPELQGCTLRWAAPEVIRGESGGTQEADIYSFGMVVVEVSPLTYLHLVPNMDEFMICLLLNPAQGLYWKVSVQRAYGPGRCLGDHGRRTTRSPAGTRFNRPSLGYDKTLLERRPCSPTQDGGGSWNST